MSTRYRLDLAAIRDDARKMGIAFVAAGAIGGITGSVQIDSAIIAGLCGFLLLIVGWFKPAPETIDE